MSEKRLSEEFGIGVFLGILVSIFIPIVGWVLGGEMRAGFQVALLFYVMSFLGAIIAAFYNKFGRGLLLGFVVVLGIIGILLLILIVSCGNHSI